MINTVFKKLSKSPIFNALYSASTTKAIDDIDLALEISEEPCPRAYITKGDALYHLGDFEHALGTYLISDTSKVHIQ